MTITSLTSVYKRKSSHLFKYVANVWPFYVPLFWKPILGQRFFCLNSGSCGSTYLVELLKSNGARNCYHEKNPSLDAIGVKYFEGKISSNRIKSVLLYTRRNIFLESNNRLFSMSNCIREAFPEASFIHLHRDPRDAIRSAMSRPSSLTFGSGRYRFNSILLCGSENLSDLERYCYYWKNYNQRILDDLGNDDFLSLRFDDLISGKVQKLERFIHTPLNIKTISPVNANKPLRNNVRYPEFKLWPDRDKETLISICGDVMTRLGYKI